MRAEKKATRLWRDWRQKTRLTLTWGHVLTVATAVLTCKAVITNDGVLGCKPCSIDDCKNETNCLLGSTMDLCNCCTKCFRVNGQTCGGVGYIVGRCGKGLKCDLAYATFTNPMGYCVSVLKPTTPPVQKLLTKAPFFDAGLHDAENFDQQSGVPRQIIPGVPTSKMAENNIKKGQTSSGNDTKYFVHTTGQWSMDTVKILSDAEQQSAAQPKVDTHSKTETQNTTHISDQRRQKIVTKASVETDISPAVIFVAVSGAVFLCLIGLLLLPVSQKSSKSPN